MDASRGSSSQPPSTNAQLNLSLVFQHLVSGFLLDSFASQPYLTCSSGIGACHRTSTSCFCIFLLFLDLLNPSCLGDPEPPFCFPHPGRPPEGPAPRGKAEAKEHLSRILAPKAEAALVTLQYFQTRLFFFLCILFGSYSSSRSVSLISSLRHGWVWTSAHSSPTCFLT